MAETRLKAEALMVLAPASVDMTDERASPASLVVSVTGTMFPRPNELPVVRLIASPTMRLLKRSVTVAVNAGELTVTGVPLGAGVTV